MKLASKPPNEIFEERLASKLFSDVAAIGPDKAGVSRPAFSDIETATLRYLEAFAEKCGLATEYDDGQNLVISSKEDAKATKFVLIGSHVDSVPMGGITTGSRALLPGSCA